LFAILLILAISHGQAEEAKLGESLFGQHHFIEYIPGDLPLVIAAPHGGRVKPSNIPTRTDGVVDIDANTQELARTIASVIHAETGRHIHLVICHLHRSKLDANRDLFEASQGSDLATHAWKEHHAYIDQACESAVKQFGVAFLIDLHGHGHADARVELGCLHNALDLADCDEALNESTYVNTSSLRWIAERSQLSFTELLRGPQSFGAMLEREGFLATPSPRMPVPTEPFFRGGYTIQRHCNAERNITGLQIEANRPRLRDTAENRLKFAHALLKVLHTYFPLHLGIKFNEPGSLVEAH
ncbi:MAG: N-formylglutamate amidohydrolase, partial [Pseudomonadota bacterium]